MAIKQKSLGTVKATRDYVLKFHNLPTVKGDRPLDNSSAKRRIRYLASRLKDGKFHSPDWAVANLGGKTFRVNGGHSSKMLLDLPGDDYPQDLEATVKEFDCDTEADLADLFDQFDRSESSRSTRDSHRAHQSLHEDLDEIAVGTVGVCTSGIAYYLHYTSQIPSRLSRDARVRLVHSNKDFILWADQYLTCVRLRRIGVVAAMYATYQADAEKADEFWREVRNEDNPDPQSATRKLSTKLREMQLDHKTGMEKKNPVMFHKVIHAANAWNTGQPTTLPAHLKSKPPAVKW